MKKVFLSCVLILFILSMAVSSFVANAEDLNMCYGNIVASGMAEKNFDDILQLMIADVDGEETVYDCADRISINGKTYRDVHDAIDAIPTGAFAKFTLQDGQISVIVFDDSPELIGNLTYNPLTKTFSGLDTTTSNLPIFYQYDDEFVSAYLDDQHLYTIELYDCAINIVGMTAIEYPETILLIDVDSYLHRDFYNAIEAYCEADVVDSCILKGKLFNEQNELIDESEGYFDGDGDISFNGLLNEPNIYTIKMWLENENGEHISPVYTKICCTKKNAHIIRQHSCI